LADRTAFFELLMPRKRKQGRIVLARKKEGNEDSISLARLWRDYVNVTGELDAPIVFG
jgi:hypothetical protein